MAILTVGSSGTYSTIAAAVAAAKDGDVVQVAAGTYTNDFVTVSSKITIEGVGGIVHLVATVSPPDGKAIMTVDTDATIKNLDFSGAKVPDANGAGIRYEGGNLDLENCSFHDNENGLLSAPIPGGQLTINDCDFYHNGNGAGNTHNLYVGDIDTLTITNSTFTDAVVGHEIKSRAENTIIENCTIADGPTGDASYSIDLPNGGNALIKDNTIEKGPDAENQTIIHYGGEAIAYAGSQLTITGNTITNDLTDHATILLTNATPISATISDNTFLGVPISTYAVGPATLSNNKTASGSVPDTTITDLTTNNSTIYETDANDHTVTLQNTGMAIKGGAGHLTATGFSHETVVGGTGGVTWNGQDGADTLYTAVGSTNTLHLGNAGNLVQSQGTDTLTLGVGNNNVEIDGTATLSGGTGNNTINVLGHATISGSGVDHIGVGASGSAVVTEANVVYLSSNGGTFSLSNQMAGKAVADTITVVGGAANLLGTQNGLSATMSGGSKGAQITLGTGTHNLISAGPDTIHAGIGMDTVVLSGNAQVYGGSAALSVFGRGINGMATVHGGTGTTTLDGDTGNITFLAEAAGASTLIDKLGNTSVVGGVGLLTVQALAGHLTVQGGSGGLVLNDSGGGQTVSTAANSQNTLNLQGFDTLTSNGTDTVKLLTGNNSVTANGAATITGSTGNNSYAMNGRDVLMTQSQGIDYTTVSSTGSVTMVSNSANDGVAVQGGRLSYATGGSAAASASVGITGWASLTKSSASNSAVQTSAGHATRVAMNSAGTVGVYGTDTITGGAGFLSITVDSNASGNVQFGAGGGSLTAYGAATVSAGAGAATVDEWGGALRFTGSSGAANLRLWAGNSTVVAGSGNTSLQGGSGTLSFQGGTGHSTVNAGSGDTTVMAGAGFMTVNAGAGHDVITLVAGQTHGPMLVNNFNDNDTVVLSGYAAGAAKTSSLKGGLLMTLSDGTKVQFTGVSHLNVVT